MAIRVFHIVSRLLSASASASAFAFAFAAGAAHAAELGDARVASHIGQPLAASLELTALEDAAAIVGVRLAHPDVYRGANIAMPAVLSNLNLHVARRDGRQFLYLSTGKPVESRHLHVYLELLDAGQRSVRLVTLWLTPDPNPAPVPLPAPVAVPVAPAPALPAAVLPVPVLPEPMMPEPMMPSKPKAAPVPAPRPPAALHEGEEYLEPRKAAAKRATAPAKKAPERKAVSGLLPVPVFKPRDTPPACAPQPAAGQLQACAALGEKNAALRHELGQIEAKVKALQGARGETPAVVPAAVAAPVAVAAAAPASATPKGAPRIQLKPKKPAPAAAQTPWGLIGAAVLAVMALAGLGVALLRRRKRSSFGKIPKEHKPARVPKPAQESESAPGDTPPKPSIMSAVKARLMPGPRKPAAAERAEPAPESAET